MVLTQSRVKLFESTACKRKVQGEYSGEGKLPPNEYMVRGLFFEQEAIGSSAHSNETVTLPRLRSGEKSVVQQRLEAQALRFKSLFNPDSSEYMGYQIINKQLLLKDGEREGTIDFVCRDEVGNISIWDLKSCEDINSIMGWGNPEKLDLIQQGFYRHLYQVNYSIVPEVFLIIFDYSPSMGIKLIKVTLTDSKMAEYLERFDSVEEQIDELELFSTEWPTTPSFADCSKCGVKCKDRVINSQIDYSEIVL